MHHRRCNKKGVYKVSGDKSDDMNLGRDLPSNISRLQFDVAVALSQHSDKGTAVCCGEVGVLIRVCSWQS